MFMFLCTEKAKGYMWIHDCSRSDEMSKEIYLLWYDNLAEIFSFSCEKKNYVTFYVGYVAPFEIDLLKKIYLNEMLRRLNIFILCPLINWGFEFF